MMRELNNEDFKEVLLPFVTGETTTYEFVKANCVVKCSKISGYQLLKTEILSTKQTLDNKIHSSRCLTMKIRPLKLTLLSCRSKNQ